MTPSMPTSASLPYWRLSGFYFFYFAVVGALVPYWGIYLKSLDYSSRDVGVITAIILATRIIAPNFWGWLADKTQRRLQIIRLGSFLAALVFAGVLVDQRYAWLVLVVSGYTFFWHAILPQFEVITLGYLGNNYHRYGRIRLWGSLGFVAAVVGLGWIFDYLPVGYLPVFILSFLILIWLSSLSFHEQPTSGTAVPGKGFMARLLQPSVICFLVASFLLQFSHGPYYTFYSLYLVENYGYSPMATGLLWALGVMAEVLMFVYIARLFHRYSLRQLMLWTLLLSGVRWLVIGYGAWSLSLLLVAQLLHACSFAVAHAVAIEIVRRQFGGGHQGQGQAMYSSMSYGAGGAIGALISGLLWDFNPAHTFLLAALAAFLAFVVSCFWLYPDSSPQVLPRYE
ncbi:MFS transporter [Cellvibrio japonicus]|nr:MFS transporter [Cellvibrio japonicus]QEI12436.1 MFS transporter [Cellvibrio japonicus]QEI16009.1 MFS transporter [Cellvibrio japonicus]QEI19588.1 MFS transporter [Cellvibrio japonicus]